MGLESATYISGLSASNPINATDVVGQGDDHLRLIKSTLLNTFPNITGAMNKTHTDLNNAAIKSDATNTFLSTLLEQALGSNTSIDNTIRNSVGGVQIRMLATSGNARIAQTNAAGTVEDIWILAARNAGVGLYYNGLEAFETTTTGVSVKSNSTNGQIELLDGSDNAFSIFKIEGSYVTLRNQQNSQDMRLELTDSGGSVQSALRAASEGAVFLYYDGAIGLQTSAAGFDVRHPTASAPDIGLRSSANALLGQVGVVGTTVRMRNRTNSGLVALTANSSAGVERNLYVGDPDGASSLYHLGVEYARTRANGFQVGATSPILEWQNASFNSRLGYIFADTSGLSFSWRSEIHGASLVIQGESTTGIARTLIIGDPDAGVSLYALNTVQLAVQPNSDAHVTSSAQVRDHGGTLRDVGFNVMPPETITASMSLDENDVGKHVRKSGGSSATLITLPSGTSGAVPPIGATTVISNFDTETVTIAAAGTLHWLDGSDGAAPTGTRTLARSGVCTVWKGTSTDWYIWGNGLS